MLHGSAFAVDLAIDGPKNGTVKMLFLCSFTELRMRSRKWDRQAVPFLGLCLGSFLEVFASGLKKRNVSVSIETLWLMATGRATRELYNYIIILKMIIYIYILLYIVYYIK